MVQYNVLFVFQYFTKWNVDILVNFNLNTLKVNACSVQYYNVPWRWRGIVSPLRFAAPSRNPGAMYFPVLDAADGSAVPVAAPKNRTTANLDSKQTKSKMEGSSLYLSEQIWHYFSNDHILAGNHKKLTTQSVPVHCQKSDSMWHQTCQYLMLASNAGVFRGARISSLPTNACSTENNFPFPSLANHIVLSKIWKVDLDCRVTC